MTPNLSCTTGRASVVRESQYMGWEKEKAMCIAAAVIIIRYHK